MPQATLNQLFGQPFPYAPVIRQTALATVAGATPVAGFTLYPNPVADQATALFESQGGVVQLILLDGLGREVRRLLDGRVLGQGPQWVPLCVRVRAGAGCLPLRGARR